ncbi:hypothetical protein [Streptomyces colonosanans]|nr:hypothetical protein [Streptomyces colonosanans]
MRTAEMDGDPAAPQRADAGCVTHIASTDLAGFTTRALLTDATGCFTRL